MRQAQVVTHLVGDGRGHAYCVIVVVLWAQRRGVKTSEIETQWMPMKSDTQPAFTKYALKLLSSLSMD